MRKKVRKYNNSTANIVLIIVTVLAVVFIVLIIFNSGSGPLFATDPSAVVEPWDPTPQGWQHHSGCIMVKPDGTPVTWLINPPKRDEFANNGYRCVGLCTDQNHPNVVDPNTLCIPWWAGLAQDRIKCKCQACGQDPIPPDQLPDSPVHR
jgi:hypothetical protein